MARADNEPSVAQHHAMTWPGEGPDREARVVVSVKFWCFLSDLHVMIHYPDIEEFDDSERTQFAIIVPGGREEFGSVGGTWRWLVI